MLTTNPNDPSLRKLRPDGMQESYLVLSEEERKKGFARPVRTKYLHLKCGTVTTMGLVLSETYARDPKFYGGTYCCHCGTHFRLREFNAATTEWEPAFLWEPDGDPVGSNAEEAAEWFAKREQREAEKQQGAGI